MLRGFDITTQTMYPSARSRQIVAVIIVAAATLPFYVLSGRAIASASSVSDGTILTVYVAGASGSSSPSTDLFAFTKDLSFGTTDPQVKLLQAYLNAHGFPVAVTGAGSPGGETTYFGQATQAALISFQRARSITPPSGYFGAITRAYIARHHGVQQ